MGRPGEVTDRQITAPRTLIEELLELVSCIEVPLERLERLRLELTTSPQPGHWPGGTAEATSGHLAEAVLLATRLRHVLTDLSDATDDAAGWESLLLRSGPPSMASETGSTDRGPTDRWWLPSLLHLAVTDNRLSDDAQVLLQRWMLVRNRLSHAVVDEVVDDVVGLSLSPWPLVDDRGRLRFPHSASAEIAVPVALLQRAVDQNRDRFAELGLLSGDLVARPIELGDVFAAEITLRDRNGRQLSAKRLDDELHDVYLDEDEVDAGEPAPHPSDVDHRRLRHADTTLKTHVAADHRLDEGLIDGRVRSGSITLKTARGPIVIRGPSDEVGRLPIVDVTWDARESAKLTFAGAHETRGLFEPLLVKQDRETVESLEKLRQGDDGT